MPTIVTVPSDLHKRVLVRKCSVHGDAVVRTVGQWTGRVMYECSECGAYVVAEDDAADDQ